MRRTDYGIAHTRVSRVIPSKIRCTKSYELKLTGNRSFDPVSVGGDFRSLYKPAMPQRARANAISIAALRHESSLRFFPG